MSEDERTWDWIYFCYCWDKEGDLDHDYPNPTIHCNGGALEEWATIPTCNCSIEESDSFFDWIKKTDGTCCSLRFINLVFLLSWYIAQRQADMLFLTNIEEIEECYWINKDSPSGIDVLEPQ
jgi:hypothetical protein